MSNPRHKPLLDLYAALLHLYPASFRRQFREQMLTTFSDILDDRGRRSGLFLILCELIPSLLREHLDEPASLIFSIRALLCALPPLAIYSAIVSHAKSFDEIALFTFWLICILTAFRQTGCRGRECLIRTMAFSVVGMLLPLAIINLFQPMFPGFLSLAAPFAVLAITIGLIFAAFARLIMEGLSLKSTRSATV
jgi:hypothetical protein